MLPPWTPLPMGDGNALEAEVRPGSLGLPLPGCTMAIVNDDGREVGPDTVGHIGMRPDPEGYYWLGYLWFEGVIVHGLLRPGAVIEISAVAVLPG